MGKKKAGADQGVNKSELIRQKFASLGWDVGPKQIIEALKADGVEASYALVSQIKVKNKAGTGTTKKRGRAAAASSNGDKPDTDYSGTGGRFDFPPVTAPSALLNVLQVVRQIRELAKSCGGKAGLIELISELG